MNTLLGYSYQGGQDVLPSAYSGFGRAGISPTFSRLLQHREKARSEEEYLDLLEQEMEKEKRSQLWGSIGGTAGGLAGNTPKVDDHKNVNKPGGKAGKSMSNMPKGHGAEKKGAGDTAANKKPVIGG